LIEADFINPSRLLQKIIFNLNDFMKLSLRKNIDTASTLQDPGS